MNSYSVLKKPIVSEKSTELRETQNKYTFVVSKDATKGQVRSAIEKAYGVTVSKVATCILRGKRKRRGMNIGMASNWKRAIVTMPEGSKLPIFDEQSIFFSGLDVEDQLGFSSSMDEMQQWRM